MSRAFDRLDVKDTRFFTDGDTVVITCRLVTRSRASGETLDLPMAQVVRVRGGPHRRVPAVLLERARLSRHRRERSMTQHTGRTPFWAATPARTVRRGHFWVAGERVGHAGKTFQRGPMFAEWEAPRR